MHYPVEVILQRTASTPELERSVFDAVRQLEEYCDRILGCQVFIRGPTAGDEGVYVVSLRLRTRDCEITIAGGRRTDPAHAEFGAALRSAFLQAKRELSSLASPMRMCRGAH
jgi:hypothetical protein